MTCARTAFAIMHIRLIDANSVGYAQHHAHDIRLSPAGFQAQAIAGMLMHVRRNIQYDPQILNLLLWDGRAQWRYDLLPTYKGNRHSTLEQREARAAYEAQRPWIARALSSFPVMQARVPNAEADDLAWGLSRQLAAQGHFVSLYTADTDWLAMVASRVRWVNARKPSQVVEIDGFAKACQYPFPQQVAAIKAIAGEDSDGINGVPDIALKRAQAILAKYGSLDGVLEAAADPFRFSDEPKYYQSLALPEMQDLVRRNRQLVDLSRGPALDGSTVEVTTGAYDSLELYEIFHDLGFLQYLDAFNQWERALDREMPLSDVLSVKRAIANVAQSWA